MKYLIPLLLFITLSLILDMASIEGHKARSSLDGMIDQRMAAFTKAASLTEIAIKDGEFNADKEGLAARDAVFRISRNNPAVLVLSLSIIEAEAMSDIMLHSNEITTEDFSSGIFAKLKNQLVHDRFSVILDAFMKESNDYDKYNAIAIFKSIPEYQNDYMRGISMAHAAKLYNEKLTQDVFSKFHPLSVTWIISRVTPYSGIQFTGIE